MCGFGDYAYRSYGLLSFSFPDIMFCALGNSGSIEGMKFWGAALLLGRRAIPR